MSDELSLADLGIDPAGTRAEDLVGQVRAGCRVEGLLGRGGQGCVYRARREADGLPVVLKVLAPELAREGQVRARFLREWQALAKLPPHPALVGVFGVSDEGPQPAIVMELVPGQALDEVVARRGPLDPATGARVAAGLARALALVHSLGLIHRDVKPHNAILTPTGEAKLVDFGLAKDVFLTSLTRPGQLLGTARYMAPELWEEGAARDARADVFALGATLYHLVCGQAPFEGDDVEEIADAIQGAEYAPPTRVIPGFPPELERVIAQMLEPELAFRYQRIADCAEDLEAVLAGGAARVPSLVAPDGRRFPLLATARVTLGTEADCGVRLAHPSVSPRHAQLRREAGAWVLRDLRSARGTQVEGEVLSGARALSEGERVRLGEVELVFRDLPRPARAVYQRDVRRSAQPDPLLEAVAQRGDPRATLAWLERLAPDPAALDEDLRGLAGALGREAAAQLRPALEAAAAVEARRAPALLPALARRPAPPAGQEVAAWLGWWVGVRASAPAQWVPPRVPRRATLAIARGGAVERRPLPDDLGALLVGRDPRCDVEVEGAARLHATLLRLARRWAFRAEPGAPVRLGGREVSAGFLDPGVPLELPGATLLVELTLPPEPDTRITPAAWFEALLPAGSPAAVGAALALLRPPPGVAEVVRELVPAAADELSAAILADYAQRAARVRPLIERWLGPDPSGWTPPAVQRLGPQLWPWGWLG
ncbi:MAG: protein kinase [Planctomycetota bacterium]